MRRRLNLIAIGVAGAIAIPVLVAVAVWARVQTIARRLSGERPRALWGPVPIISIKFWSEALRARGYESTTLVESISRINVREDFDLHTREFLGGGRLANLSRPYYPFGWAVLHADLFMSFFDGGFLRHTHLRRLEAPLLKLAGKRLAVSPYGSDVAVPGYLGPTEGPLLDDYPEFRELGPATKKRVDYFARWADVVVRNYQNGYMPRGDVVWVTQLAIDTEAWRSSAPPGDGDGRSGEVVVLHAPNHRHVKGTAGLLSAIEELQGEGLKVRLQLMEMTTNAEVRSAIETADIVADQFIAGYAMFAIEGLAAGKPVLSALSGMPPEVRASGALDGCPIVDTRLDNLTEELRRLITDPELRRRLGESSREFALSHHSQESVGRGWEAIVRHLWEGEPLPEQLPVEEAATASLSEARAETV